MKYQIPSQLQEKLSVHSESDANAIRDCLAVFQHIAKLNAALDNEQGRSFSVNFLHKSNAGFKRKTKSELNVTLDRLKALGVISESALTATTSGKTKEVRYLSPLWLNGTFDELEAKLFNLLTTAPAVVTPVLESAEVTPLATEVTPLATNANGGNTQIIEIALRVYDVTRNKRLPR